MYKLVIGDSFKKAYSRLSKAEQDATDKKLALLAEDPFVRFNLFWIKCIDVELF